MALLTNKTYLFRSTDGSTYSEVCAITSYPDLGGAPETIDITTLRDGKQRSMNGLQAGEALEFGALYTVNDFTLLKGYESEDAVTDEGYYYQVRFGDVLGSKGIWTWQGKLSVFAVGGEPNARRDMTITISDEGETELTWSVGTADVVTITSSVTTVTVGDTITITATSSTSGTITFTSSNATVASIDSSTGVVTGNLAGTTIITATSSNGGTKTVTITVTSE